MNIGKMPEGEKMMIKKKSTANLYFSTKLSQFSDLARIWEFHEEVLLASWEDTQPSTSLFVKSFQ